MTDLPDASPVEDSETAAFWEAARNGVLMLPRCRACARLFWYPREFCPRCGGIDIDAVPATGHGRVFSCTVVRKAAGAFADAVPYVLAYVELDEGLRLLTNIVDCEPESVAIGDPVVLSAAFRSGSTPLYRFAPDRDA